MYFDKLIWNSVSPLRKDSTYISLEYVVNDLGIYCKGEQRTKDVGFASSRIGAPLGLKAVENADYAAKSLGRAVILWSRITDVSEDKEKGVIVVSGNAHSKMVLACEASMKNTLLSRIDSMRRYCASSPSSDKEAAAWAAWAADNESYNSFEPLDTLIENERLQIENRLYSLKNLSAVILPVEEAAEAVEDSFDESIPEEDPPAEEVIVPEPAPAPKVKAFCASCGKPLVPGAAYCGNCGAKI